MPRTEPADGRPPTPRPGTIRQGDRDKAYRPLPAGARRAAFEQALGAYAEGDFFEAHERLEPAWMGTDDLSERALHQGLIKLAAAYVHAVRGNPAGTAKNLEGARRHLARAEAAARTHAVDLVDLVTALDERLARLRAGDPDPAPHPPVIRRTAPA